jgi:demethylmenaquinone methyltransferase/2-methoxy-6-polyprenyl-1,4-benzoquinol methylase
MGLSSSSSNAIFNTIADRYDAVNAVLSFGAHQHWRRTLARRIPAGSRRVLDLACGTAAIPLTLLTLRPDICLITGIDIADNMLRIGRNKLKHTPHSDRVTLQQGDALNMPFNADSFDTITIGFALRNVPDIMKLLASAYRVLKPSGTFLILEFSRPKILLSRLAYTFYLRAIVPFIGILLTGNWSAYRHLGVSILHFPEQGRFKRMLEQAGFTLISSTPMALGAVTLTIVQK